ncbi:divergent polysaccharide deacetylase family protein [Ruegeria sp. 6PALISEP08]|uniref:divergent polysaccharide deacetylase family protein n=1 Tax=Ruegeria sp. 6PALISEP08 TaxID=1225660 RepID=UPI00067EEC1A|nr:divergent polysaccharide deacetylase family protein [Ruegeria sp. 6PALISEP08]
MGGFFGGMIAGAIVVLILGVVVSLKTPMANTPVVSTQAPAPTISETPEAPTEVAEAVSDADLVELAPSALEVADDATEELADLSGLEASSDTQPVVDEAAEVVDEPEAADVTEVSVVTEAPAAPPEPSLAPSVPQDEAIPAVIDDTPTPPTEEPETTEVALLQPEQDPLPQTADTEEENPFESSPIAVEGDEDTLPRKLPRIAALPQIGSEQQASGSSTVGTRVVPLTERNEEPVVEEASAEQPIPSGKPIERYAVKFENPESKPLMSIILIDDEGAFGTEALQDFPYPISFAVNPSDPDAAEKMARHRAAGFEVMALADLPEAATAQDAEVSLSVWLDTLPETVGILEGVNSGIHGNRKLADQVAEIAAGTGRGLITQDNGLNTVQKLAARNGTPSGVVFRDIDGARQDPKVMRRFLDQAAFRAGQEGAVVMLGRVRPETISALLLWGLEDRGNRVAMAPISAVMMKQVQ